MFEGTTKSLNVADLECPTFGLGPGTDTDGKPCRTTGPRYLPLIVPPPQVLSLDPEWLKACTGLTFLRSESFKFRDLRPTHSAAACLWTRSLRLWPQDNGSSDHTRSAFRSSTNPSSTTGSNAICELTQPHSQICRRSIAHWQSAEPTPSGRPS